MVDLLIRIVINAAALIVAARVVPGIKLQLGPTLEDWLKVAAVALIFALINTYLRPIVKAVSLPISLLTVGLVGLVINAAMLLVLAFVAKGLSLPFAIEKFPPTLNGDALVAAFLGGIIISIVATLLSFALSARRGFGMRL